MSALLASSFVGRVAAFKATKVQVRVSMRVDAFDASSRARGVNRVARAVRGDGCVAAYRAPRAMISDDDDGTLVARAMGRDATRGDARCE